MLYILNILSILMLLYGFYYIVFAVFSFKNYKKEIFKKYEPKNSFKILIACRNEEKVIKELIESLKSQNYPKNLYEICVIPNNCTDSTEEISMSVGARIIKCNYTSKCKADALRCAFKELENEEFDAYAVFDADNIVHPDFLSRMNDTLCSGYEIVQGNRDSKNPEDSWISGSYALYYWIQNMFFNRARININSSASINGTGYVVKKQVIQKVGFDTKTLTEDIEFTAKCAINNIKIGYQQKAITYDEQPIGFKASVKQRKRWSTGAHKCLKLYSKDLLTSFLKTKNLLCMDMILNFMSPFVQVFSTIIAIIMIVLKLSIQIELAPLTILAVMRITGIHFGIISYLINVFINIYITKYNKRKLKPVFKSILTFTIFILTWIPINFVSIFAKESKWEEIKHTRCMKIEDIEKEDIPA